MTTRLYRRSGVSPNTQGFLYDQWGNRRIDQTTTTTSPNINKKDYTVDGATNQLGVPVGQLASMSYDDVGNLILDTYTSNLTAGMQYDADNKMTSAANGGQQYRYNADSKRVKRIITGTGGGQFWMVYGIGGELVAEYNATSGTPAVTNPSKEYGYRGGQMLIVAESTAVVKWLVQDHLGSTRMEIGIGGAIGDVIRHDYLPFGEELAGTMRVGNGYGAVTNTKQKFTGYERDNETGLDYAQARYMSSVQGRFTSVDPDGIGAAVEEPQSWNAYAYVGNRPTTLTDPSGLLWYRPKGRPDAAPEWFDNEPGSKYELLNWSEHVYKGIDGLYYSLDPNNNRFTSSFTESTARASFHQMTIGDLPMERQNMEAFDQTMMFMGGAGLVRSAATVTVTTIARAAFTGLARKSVASAGEVIVAETATVAAEQGGLNLFKWGVEQTASSTGWKAGDYFLHLANQGAAKLNWRANYSALRYEMSLGKPIYDSYRLANGNLVPTGGFLNAERYILQSRGWVYNPAQGAWLAPK